MVNYAIVVHALSSNGSSHIFAPHACVPFTAVGVNIKLLLHHHSLFKRNMREFPWRMGSDCPSPVLCATCRMRGPFRSCSSADHERAPSGLFLQGYYGSMVGDSREAFHCTRSTVMIMISFQVKPECIHPPSLPICSHYQQSPLLCAKATVCTPVLPCFLYSPLFQFFPPIFT